MKQNLWGDIWESVLKYVWLGHRNKEDDESLRLDLDEILKPTLSHI